MLIPLAPIPLGQSMTSSIWALSREELFFSTHLEKHHPWDEQKLVNCSLTDQSSLSLPSLKTSPTKQQYEGWRSSCHFYNKGQWWKASQGWEALSRSQLKNKAYHSVFQAPSSLAHFVNTIRKSYDKLNITSFTVDNVTVTRKGQYYTVFTN